MKIHSTFHNTMNDEDDMTFRVYEFVYTIKVELLVVGELLFHGLKICQVAIISPLS